MKSPEKDNEDEASFVNINLDDRQTPRPTMDTLATPISNLRMGWMSQMSLQSHSNLPSHESLKRIQNKTIASSSTPNLALPKRNQEDVFREHTPFSHTDGEKISPLKRGVEGKYRSRTEAPGSSSRLRPLLLTGKGPSPPRGVVYDSNMVPGVSMTVQDLNGELVSVRSPTKFDSSEYFPSRFSYKAVESPVPKKGSSSWKDADNNTNAANSDTTFEMHSVSPKNSSQNVHTGLSTVPSEKPTGSSAKMSSNQIIPPLHVPKGGSSNLTRMPHLPPKPRKEEAKHLADFERMMQESKQAEKRRVVSRRSELRKRQEDEEHARLVWEREIMPCWTRAREDERLWNLWWGGIPQVLRARLWPRACGNDLMLSHKIFPRALESAQRAIASGAFPDNLLEAIKNDITQTLPSLRLFDEQTGPLYQDLIDVLLAFVFVRADEASQREQLGFTDVAFVHSKYTLYVPGVANLAAILIMNLTPTQSLILLLNLIAKKCWLKAIYGLQTKSGTEDLSSKALPVELQGYERVFNALLAERMPNIYANLHKAGVLPAEYVREWVRTLFVPWVEIDTAARLWDIMYVYDFTDKGRLLDDGDSVLFRVSLAFLELLEPRLFVRDRDELVSVLQGSNKGAIHVWRRELDGNLEDTTPPKDRIYAQYQMNESSIFERLFSQNVWWKDMTLQRLLDRELNR